MFHLPPCNLFLVRCYDAAGKDTCEWRVRNGHDCKAYYMEVDCAATCGYCGIDKKKTNSVIITRTLKKKLLRAPSLSVI